MRINNPHFLFYPGEKIFLKTIDKLKIFCYNKITKRKEIKEMKKYLVTVCIEYEVVAETDYEAELEAESMFRASSHNVIDYFITEEKEDK